VKGSGFDVRVSAALAVTVILWASAFAGIRAGLETYGPMAASRAASFLYLIPPTAYLIAWLWLAEVPTLVSVVGGVVTLAGVPIVNTRGRRR
jgi:drug/metabolite transporter (DMT)-like permease